MRLHRVGEHTRQPSDSPLALACSRWQSGREGGSSLLRGAARVTTGERHYFRAPFITEYETDAEADPTAIDEAKALLEAIAEAKARPAEQWCEKLDLVVPEPFTGRGIEAKGPEIDDQITASLARGTITMPLWGISLDRKVAESFGTRFVFEIEGPVRGVPAWRESGVKVDEAELITGGRYEVSTTQDGETTRVTLRECDWPFRR